jgi:hypothetical protein
MPCADSSFLCVQLYRPGALSGRHTYFASLLLCILCILDYGSGSVVAEPWTCHSDLLLLRHIVIDLDDGEH